MLHQFAVSIAFAHISLELKFKSTKKRHCYHMATWWEGSLHDTSSVYWRIPENPIWLNNVTGTVAKSNYFEVAYLIRMIPCCPCFIRCNFSFLSCELKIYLKYLPCQLGAILAAKWKRKKPIVVLMLFYFKQKRKFNTTKILELHM